MYPVRFPEDEVLFLHRNQGKFHFLAKYSDRKKRSQKTGKRKRKIDEIESMIRRANNRKKIGNERYQNDNPSYEFGRQKEKVYFDKKYSGRNVHWKLD